MSGYTEDQYERAKRRVNEWLADGTADPGDEEHALSRAIEAVFLEDQLVDSFPQIFDGRPQLLKLASTLAELEKTRKRLLELSQTETPAELGGLRVRLWETRKWITELTDDFLNELAGLRRAEEKETEQDHQGHE